VEKGTDISRQEKGAMKDSMRGRRLPLSRNGGRIQAWSFGEEGESSIREMGDVAEIGPQGDQRLSSKGGVGAGSVVVAKARRRESIRMARCGA